MIRIDYYGVEGTGRTLKEAKADAGRKIKSMLDGDYVPETIVFKGIAALIWREPYGWFSKTLTDYETGQIEGRRLNGSASSATRAETIMAARMSLVQMAWAAGDDSADLAEFVEFLGDHQAASFASWVRFQLEYKKLKAAGVSETDCHRQACEAMYLR